MSKISVRNITRVFRTATPEQLETGLAWYFTAHTLSDSLGSTYSLPIDRVAGIISAFSPQRGWSVNISQAIAFIASNGTTGGHTGANVTKALKIFTGADPVITLNGLKTTNFYRCIMSRGLSDDVTIDRHAYDVAVYLQFY